MYREDFEVFREVIAILVCSLFLMKECFYVCDICAFIMIEQIRADTD